MDELKPCPFCGGAAMLITCKYRHNQTLYYVTCSNDDCAIAPETSEYLEARYAVEYWNRRFTDDQKN